MDKLTQYRELIQNLLADRANLHPARKGVNVELVIDPVRDHYEIIHLGWDAHRRIHGCVLHVDIVEGKFWVQYDGTSDPIAEDLLEAGVPSEDIVLGFQPAEVRPYTDFAAA